MWLGRLLNWSFVAALGLAVVWIFWVSYPHPGPFLEQMATLSVFLAVPVSMFLLVRYGFRKFVNGMADGAAMRRRAQRFGRFLRRSGDER